MYVAYLTEIMIWCILGAVLNPEKFLPFAVGSVVIVAFVVLLWTRVKKVDSSLKNVINGTIDTELKVSLSDTIRMEQLKFLKQRNPPVEQSTRVQFTRFMTSYMTNNSYPAITGEECNRILDGDVDLLLQIMTK
jgi:sensor domain CHASE-containing protein